MSITCSLNVQYLNQIRAFTLKAGDQGSPLATFEHDVAIFIRIGEKIDNQKSTP